MRECEKIIAAIIFCSRNSNFITNSNIDLMDGRNREIKNSIEMAKWLINKLDSYDTGI